MNAKIMLVCDRDIMKLDVSNMNTSVCETLLATTVVSDWNCRAWTFLEAFRARRTIHLLCQNNAVVSLKQVIEDVHRNGILEFEILFLAMPHFLPSFDDSKVVVDKSRYSWRQRFPAGYLPIETSGSLLSHRLASRPGDDFVIWSLLMSENSIYHDAEAFWKAMQGRYFGSSEAEEALVSPGASISTQYLVSSAPRLKIRGLGWAPASPIFRFSSHSVTDGFSVFDGGNSAIGTITPDGFVADWFLWKFDSTTFWQQMETKCLYNLSRVTAQFLQGYRWGAILCPNQQGGMAIEVSNSMWWEDGGRLRRTVVVVCGTNELDGPVVETYTRSFKQDYPGWDKNSEVVGWEWRGVYAWDDVEPLPQIRRANKFLIV